MVDMRRVDVDDVTWLVTDCRYCPFGKKKGMECGMSGRKNIIGVPIPGWCPLDKVQGWNNG